MPPTRYIAYTESARNSAIGHGPHTTTQTQHYLSRTTTIDAQARIIGGGEHVREDTAADVRGLVYAMPGAPTVVSPDGVLKVDADTKLVKYSSNTERLRDEVMAGFGTAAEAKASNPRGVCRVCCRPKASRQPTVVSPQEAPS